MLLLLCFNIHTADPEKDIIPINSRDASPASLSHKSVIIQTDDREIARDSLFYCFQERYRGFESHVVPFLVSRVDVLRSAFNKNAQSDSSSSSDYVTPPSQSSESSSISVHISLDKEVDDTIKEAVADSLEETFTAYEARMRELEQKVLVQQAIINAQENSSTPRERRRALIIGSVTTLASTTITALVTYYATR